MSPLYPAVKTLVKSVSASIAHQALHRVRHRAEGGEGAGASVREIGGALRLRGEL